MQRAVNLDICQKTLYHRLLQLNQLQEPNTQLKGKPAADKPTDVGEPEQKRIMTLYIAQERRQIERALSRIKQKDYGWCKDCGHHIGADRLESNPSTELCTRCVHDGDH